jgi:hypothetical protein
MLKRTMHERGIALPAVAAVIVVMSVALAWGRSGLPEGNGKEIVKTACSVCHELNRVTENGYSYEGWQAVLDTMIAGGARVPKDKIAVVAAYLAKNFPENANPAGRERSSQRDTRSGR